MKIKNCVDGPVLLKWNKPAECFIRNMQSLVNSLQFISTKNSGESCILIHIVKLCFIMITEKMHLSKLQVALVSQGLSNHHQHVELLVNNTAAGVILLPQQVQCFLKHVPNIFVNSCEHFLYTKNTTRNAKYLATQTKTMSWFSSSAFPQSCVLLTWIVCQCVFLSDNSFSNIFQGSIPRWLCETNDVAH